MNSPQLKLPLFGLPLLLLGGCCYFTPCHPATYIVGTVVDDTSGQAISDATVKLYNRDTQSHTSGCFSLGGPDAIPFEFSVSAPGYSPVAIEPAPGSYRAVVSLIPAGTPEESTVVVTEVPREQYDELSRGCP